ncbi:MAG: GAF domain-containing protein, partial [Thermodesulfobacteriota bacterium]|nr:GAF domain-containing protein [Thermodesulfobacteriota bacterium]
MSNKPLKVLLIEDNRGDARLLTEMLKETETAKVELIHKERLDDGLQCFDDTSFDVLLLDLNLPDSRGLESFNEVYSKIPAMPIIVLTGLDDEELAMRIVRAGAQDYLVKGQFDGNLLINSMLYAIERKVVAEDLKKRNQELYSLNTIAATISQSLELSKVLADTLSTILDLMSLQAGWIFLREKDSEQLTLASHLGLSPQFIREEAEKPLGSCVCFHVMQRKKPIIAENILKCPRLSKSVVKREGLKCHASVPLVSKDSVVGVMNLASKDFRPFSTEDLDLLIAIGHQVGVAIENARLFEETQKKSIELEKSYERVKSLYEELKEEKEKSNTLKKFLEERFGLENIIGKNHRMQAIYDLIENVAPTDSTVLIQGESGTG